MLKTTLEELHSTLKILHGKLRNDFHWVEQNEEVCRGYKGILHQLQNSNIHLGQDLNYFLTELSDIRDLLENKKTHSEGVSKLKDDLEALTWLIESAIL